MTGWRGLERRQQVIKQRDRGVRVHGGALPEGLIPPGLESRGRFLAHLLRGVGVQAAHSRDLVSKPLLGQDLGMPSSAIHILWPCRRPCGVSPS